MKNSCILGFILILIIVSNTVNAQIGPYKIWEENKNVKIALADIIGNWYAIDSSNAKISFLNNNNCNVYIEGIRDGVGDYMFTIDSDSIAVNGTAANWPPYDCTLSLISRNLLKIEFYQYFSTETQKIIYKR